MPSAHVLQSAIDSLSVGMVVVSSTGTVVYLDRAARRDLNIDESKFGEVDWFEHFVAEDIRQRARRRFQQFCDAARTEEIFTSPVETVGETAKSVVWKRVISDDDDLLVAGRLVATVEQSGSLMDEGITDPYRTLVDSFPNGMVTLFDRHYRYLIVGGTIFETLSLTPDDINGQTLHEVFPEENVRRLQPLYDAALDGQENTVTLSLEGRSFKVQILPVRNQEGDVVAGMTVSQDITAEQAREQELQDIRTRYQALIDHAPVPIIVGDESGEIVEMNDAAGSLLGRSRADILGSQYFTLCLDRSVDDCQKFFTDNIEYFACNSRRYLPDGRQIHVTTNRGNRIPVELSVSTITQAGGRLFHGLLRDISERVWYEDTLEELHESSGELLSAETEVEVAEYVVDAAIDILDLQLVSVNLYNPDEETLDPVAYSDDVPNTIGEPPSLPLNDSVAGEVFLSNNSSCIDDVSTANNVYDENTNIESQLIVPIDEFGVILCGHTEPLTFTYNTQRLIELLARHAEAVFDRAKREQDLRRREQDLAVQSKKLQQVEVLNRDIRELTQIAIRAEHRIELQQESCDLFETNDSYVFAWCGELSPDGDELVAQTWAGEHQGYLDAFRFEIADNVTEPAVQTAKTKTTTVVSNIARDVQSNPWRREAIRRGFRSVIAVPILYQDVLYGVLAIYSDQQSTFTSLVQSVLEDWAELIGYAVN